MSAPKQETPTEHSSLIGGSTASRRINCPVSFHLEKIAPKSRGSSYAREGTALHEMIAIVLDQNKTPEELLPFTHNQPAKGIEAPWSMTIDQDLWDELGQPALDMFDQFLDELEAEQEAPAVFHIEKSFEFPDVPGAFGTSDVVFRCGDVGGIWDWKFGRGEVSAEENSQLMFYFASAFEAMPEFFKGIEDVHLCISQPKTRPETPKVWVTDPSRINEFINEVFDAMDQIEGGSAKTLEPNKGPWCQFADCKAVCPLHFGAAAKLGEKMATLEARDRAPVNDKGENAPADKIDMDAFLAEAMELADMAESWAKHIAGITQERLENGGDVEGWKIVAKKSSGREWVLDDDKIKRRLASRGLKAADYQTVKLVSPAQAETKLKKLGKKLPEELCEKKPSSGYTLTRDGDPRPSAETPAKRAIALGSALAKRLNAQE